jgi:transcriptional regulator with XRE-family HTH domain
MVMMFDPHEHTMSIVNRIRMVRTYRGITARQLGRNMAAIGVYFSRDMIASIESGRRLNITTTELCGLAQVLAVNVSWLATGVGPMCAHCADDPPTGFMCTSCGLQTTDGEVTGDIRED